jgi:hypothetical protein
VRATDSLVSKVCSKINNDKITNLAAEQGWKVTQTWPPMLSAHYRPYGSGHAPSIVAHPGVHDRNIELLALFPGARHRERDTSQDAARRTAIVALPGP